MTTDVSVTVAETTGVRVTGTLDGVVVDDAPVDTTGPHVISAGSTIFLDAGAATPVVAGAPAQNADWIAPGGGFGGSHPLYQVLSLIIAMFLGVMGLPHVLVRFYTNPDGRAARRTTVAGREIDLSAREFALAEQFLRHPGAVLTREELLSRIWGLDFDPGSNVVDVYVRYLRTKLGADHIVTVRGEGYRWE